jgi:hypothetical protein
MNQFMDLLSDGDLRSDGRSDEVVEAVLNDPVCINTLITCLQVENTVIRGHAADAVEKIGRQKPEFLLPFIETLIHSAVDDPLAVVQWHLAMLFGHLALFSQVADPMIAALLKLLVKDKSLVVSWAIKSLCVFAVLYPDYQEVILGKVIDLEGDDRAAVSIVLGTAKKILMENGQLPIKWIKSPIIANQISLEYKY